MHVMHGSQSVGAKTAKSDILGWKYCTSHQEQDKLEYIRKQAHLEARSRDGYSFTLFENAFP
jgi:hypothetical protein